jgi:4-hydroxybenzoate polyprenyltransferase
MIYCYQLILALLLVLLAKGVYAIYLSNMNNYLALIRFDKQIGTLLLLWPALIGLWVAEKGNPELSIVAIFSLGTVLMRSAGCIINDLADRDIDPFVARTRNRPLASGKISIKQAMCMFILLIISAFCLVLLLNLFTILLSVSALLLAILYPFTKRYTYYPQVILGLAFAWPVLMAFTAVRNDLPVEAIWLYLAMVCWIIAFDTQYAMVDKADDLKIGVKSTAIVFQEWDKLIIGCLQAVSLIGLYCLGLYLQLGIYYYCGLFLASVCLCYQQYLLKDRLPEKCFRAFLNNNYFGMAIFLGLFMDSF